MREPNSSEPASYHYAVIRVVPRVEREEFLNAGVILFCPEQNFLGARVHLDETRLRALSPEADFEMLSRHLEAIPRICSGEKDAGPIGQLLIRERFHWLASPRSTVIQVSAIHSGICQTPELALEDLFQGLVL